MAFLLLFLLLVVVVVVVGGTLTDFHTHRCPIDEENLLQNSNPDAS